MWSVLHPFSLQTSTAANIRPGLSVCAFKDKTHGKWVFEKDIFDSNVHNRGRNDDENSLHEDMDEESGLIPNEWLSLQVGLHKTKAERKKELQLQQLEESRRKSLELRQKKEQLETKFVSYNTSDEYLPSVNIPKMLHESTCEKEKSIPLEEKRRNESDFHLFNDEEKACLNHTVTDWTQIQCDGYTAIQRAVLARKETAVSQLLRAGASINVYDKDGASLLHFSAQTGSLNLVRLFIKHGLDVNHCDEFGWTPLHLATLISREDIVRHLLISGAEKNLRTKDGQMPLDICLTLGKGFRTYAVAKSLKLLPKG